jgi:hypothetical protein
MASTAGLPADRSSHSASLGWRLADFETLLSVTTTPSDREPGTGAIGANEAVLCVMDELDAPDDMRREAAAGTEDGSGAWSNYSATWAHPDALTIELRVTQE